MNEKEFLKECGDTFLCDPDRVLDNILADEADAKKRFRIGPMLSSAAAIAAAIAVVAGLFWFTGVKQPKATDLLPQNQYGEYVIPEQNIQWLGNLNGIESAPVPDAGAALARDPQNSAVETVSFSFDAGPDSYNGSYKVLDSGGEKLPFIDEQACGQKQVTFGQYWGLRHFMVMYPDRTKILFVLIDQCSILYEYDLASGTARRLSAAETDGITPEHLTAVNRDTASPFWAYEPVISPDSRYVAFKSNRRDYDAWLARTGNGDDSSAPVMDLWVLDIASGTETMAAENAEDPVCWDGDTVCYKTAGYQRGWDAVHNQQVPFTLRDGYFLTAALNGQYWLLENDPGAAVRQYSVCDSDGSRYVDYGKTLRRDSKIYYCGDTPAAAPDMLLIPAEDSGPVIKQYIILYNSQNQNRVFQLPKSFDLNVSGEGFYIGPMTDSRHVVIGAETGQGYRFAVADLGDLSGFISAS